MEIVLLAAAAAGASLLTFFSGFGLGTILLPVFLLFYPPEVAIALTAIVHFLNGMFKTGLIGRHAAQKIILHFGIPAIVFALLGAYLLTYLASFPVHVQYKLLGMPLSTSPVNVVIGLLLLIFAISEILPTRKHPHSSRRWLWAGGTLSGFFGGLSGHQGALRSTFLIRIGLSKEQFIATGIVISLMIDLMRLPVYLASIGPRQFSNEWLVLATTAAAAFLGAFFGRKLLHKVTLTFVQYLVAAAVSAIGVLLAIGVL